MNWISLTAIIVLSANFLFGQNQGNNWYFGNQAGISFNSGNPTALTDGQTYIIQSHCEGTTAISDDDGNLLFYSNGEKLWNNSHTIMPNGDGLLGGYSSTQSSLIVPQPENDRFYYLFTTDQYNGNNLVNGLNYSIVDMCEDMGNGDVLQNMKNVPLMDSTAEKLTCVRHANGIDYWILTHRYFSNQFAAFLLTSNGISDTVISAIGSIHQVNCPGDNPNWTQAAIGYLKASPNGSRLAIVNLNTCSEIREVFDFNSTTGQVTNHIDLLENTGNTTGGYGIEFSPDNSMLYVSDIQVVTQYDLTAGNGDPNSIRNSATVVSNLAVNEYPHALQLGPDGKIYVARYQHDFLAVINEPNVSGTNCDFQDAAVSLNGKECSMGLPNLIAGYSYSNQAHNCSVGISSFQENISFECYPNPTNDKLTVQIDQATYLNEKISLFNTLGQVVLELQVNQPQITLDISNLPNGLYFLSVGTAFDGTKRKVIKNESTTPNTR